MNGMMKVVTLNGGRYVGLPKHIAARIVEATKYRLSVDGEEKKVIHMEPIVRSEFKRSTCTTIRNRTAYDDQKWFRLPTEIVGEVSDDFFAVGKQVVVQFKPETNEILVRGTGRDA